MIKKEKFDCVAFKRKAQEKINKEIKYLSISEQVEYFHKKANTGEMGKLWKALKHEGQYPANRGSSRQEIVQGRH